MKKMEHFHLHPSVLQIASLSCQILTNIYNLRPLLGIVKGQQGVKVKICLSVDACQLMLVWLMLVGRCLSVDACRLMLVGQCL